MTVKRKERGEDGTIEIQSPLPTVHSKSNMAGRINDRSLQCYVVLKKKRKAQNILTTRSTGSVENMQLKFLMF